MQPGDHARVVDGVVVTGVRHRAARAAADRGPRRTPRVGRRARPGEQRDHRTRSSRSPVRPHRRRGSARPSDTWSSVIASLARFTGCRKFGDVTSGPSRIRVGCRGDPGEPGNRRVPRPFAVVPPRQMVVRPEVVVTESVDAAVPDARVSRPRIGREHHDADAHRPTVSRHPEVRRTMYAAYGLACTRRPSPNVESGMSAASLSPSLRRRSSWSSRVVSDRPFLRPPVGRRT